MKKNSKHWIIVKNKLTYLLLLTVPVGLLKIFLYDINLDNYMNVLEQIFLSIIIVLIGVYLFIRLLNTNLFTNNLFKLIKIN